MDTGRYNRKRLLVWFAQPCKLLRFQTVTGFSELKGGHAPTSPIIHLPVFGGDRIEKSEELACFVSIVNGKRVVKVKRNTTMYGGMNPGYQTHSI